MFDRPNQSLTPNSPVFHSFVPFLPFRSQSRSGVCAKTRHFATNHCRSRVFGRHAVHHRTSRVWDWTASVRQNAMCHERSRRRSTHCSIRHRRHAPHMASRWVGCVVLATTSGRTLNIIMDLTWNDPHLLYKGLAIKMYVVQTRSYRSQEILHFNNLATI